MKEKNIRINGLIEKIYCRFHDPNLMPNDTKYKIDQLLPRSSMLINEKPSPAPSSSSPIPAGNIAKKRRTISLSSDDDIVELIPENDFHRLTKKRSTKQTNLNPRKRDEFIDQI